MEKFILKSVLIVGSLCALAACGPPKPKTAISPMKVLSGDVTLEQSGRASGTGLTKFDASLASRETTLTIVLEGSLNHSGSQISIRSHAQAQDLSDGVRVTFTRMTTDNVQCEIQVGRALISRVQSSRMIPVRFDRISLLLEIHNQFPRARVVAWPAESPREGTLAIFDSDYAAHMDAPLNGVAPGLDVGLRLTDAIVTRAEIN